MQKLVQCTTLLLFICSFCSADEEHTVTLRVRKRPLGNASRITVHMDKNPKLKIVIQNNTDRPFNYRVFPSGRIQGLRFTLLWRGKVVARTNGLRSEQKLQVLKPKEKIEQIVALRNLNILPGPWRGPKWLRSGDYMAHIELQQASPIVPDTPEWLRKPVRIVIE